jgi:hypothetical protein
VSKIWIWDFASAGRLANITVKSKQGFWQSSDAWPKPLFSTYCLAASASSLAPLFAGCLFGQLLDYSDGLSVWPSGQQRTLQSLYCLKASFKFGRTANLPRHTLNP